MKLNARLRNTAGAAAFTLSVLFSTAIVNTPSTYAAQPYKGSWTVTIANTDGDTIRVRDGAGSQYDQVGEAHEGDAGSILDGPGVDSKGNTWYKVKLPNGSGWVRSDFFSTGGTSSSSSSSKSSSSTGKTASKPAAAAPAPASAPRLSGAARVANTDGDNLRIRKDHSTDAATLTNIAPDSVVTIKQGPVVSEKITWYQVSVNGVTGWAMGQYLAQASAQAAKVAAPAPAQAAKPAAPSAPKPAAPAAPKPAAAPKAPAAAAKPAAPQAPAQPAVQKSAAPAAPAPAAQPAQAQQSAARSGTSRAAVAPSNPSSSVGSSIVSTAMRYVGYRYRFGGTTPAGFDCSGFVYYVVNHSGRSISRDMGAQLNSGTRVSTSNLQPGDLLFFSNTYKRGLSHAGIYIGNGRFIHAENESTGVVVSDLWSAYWASHYTAAVRVH